MMRQMAKSVIGQEEVVRTLTLALLCNGNVLLEGLPGTAKTRSIKTLSRVLQAKLGRIQFTPDLLPSDVTGNEIYLEKQGKSELTFQPGPIFSELVLADEINRAPAKVQSALLEAMEERQVTVAGNTYRLPELFMVLATQNPIDQEGTYPLPEAQLDRFMFLVQVEYPSMAEELQIVEMTTKPMNIEHTEVLSGPQILEIQEVVRKVPIAEHFVRYVLRLVRATRPNEPDAPEHVRKRVAWGAGPRASQFMILGAKARALLHGRVHVTTEDVQKVAYPVLRHRVIMNYAAEAEGFTSDKLVAELLASTPAGESETLRDERLPNVLGS
jgi:MoxR-like ATPase